MGDHPYHKWFSAEELCPALYVSLTRPNDTEPFLEDLIAAVDTGSPFTFVPEKHKRIITLHPARTVSLKWPYFGPKQTATYLVKVKADVYEPRLVEIVFSPFHSEYALIGRNLMKHWQVILNGPEQTMEIKE